MIVYIVGSEVSVYELAPWLLANCSGHYGLTMTRTFESRVSFTNENDASLFKLAYGEVSHEYMGEA